MPKKLSEIAFGESVWDMHEGNPDAEKLFGPGVELIRITNLGIRGGSKVIEAMVPGCSYTNKMLVLVGTSDTCKGMQYQFAYSYDSQKMGILIFNEVPN